MKKLFAILAVASVMTACNSGSEEKAATTDSPKVETPVANPIQAADSAAKAVTGNDSLASKAVQAVKDTASKMMEKGKDKVVEKVKEAVKH